MQADEDQTPEVALCTHCAAPVQGTDNFCPECGCPLTFAAATMPYESVLAKGFIWREGSDKPRKLIILVGMWILLIPGLAGAVIMFVVDLIASRRLAGEADTLMNVAAALLILTAEGISCLVVGALLYKTTRNYLRLRRMPAEVNDTEDADVVEQESSDDDA